MTTEKQLIEELIGIVESMEYGGICKALDILWNRDIYEEFELNRLESLIFSNRPPLKYHNSGFWWHPNKIKSRIKFLNNLKELIDER